MQDRATGAAFFESAALYAWVDHDNAAYEQFVLAACPCLTISKNRTKSGYNFRREDTRTCSGDESPRQSTEKVLFIWLSFPMVV